jgi:hypothetical protein
VGIEPFDNTAQAVTHTLSRPTISKMPTLTHTLAAQVSCRNNAPDRCNLITATRQCLAQHEGQRHHSLTSDSGCLLLGKRSGVVPGCSALRTPPIRRQRSSPSAKTTSRIEKEINTPKRPCGVHVGMVLLQTTRSQLVSCTADTYRSVQTAHSRCGFNLIKSQDHPMQQATCNLLHIR